MFPDLSRQARQTAFVIALLSAVSVAVQFVHINAVRAELPLATVWDMARYFTILTHLLVAVSYAAISSPRATGVSAPWLAALTLSVVMVGLVYHAVLSQLVTFSGLGWWADHGLHTISPAAMVIWWLVHAPKRRLAYSDLPLFALWPAIYAAYALARGSWEGAYPYPFIDLGTLGAAAVAMNMSVLLVLFLLGGVVMISIGRYADR